VSNQQDGQPQVAEIVPTSIEGNGFQAPSNAIGIPLLEQTQPEEAGSSALGGDPEGHGLELVRVERQVEKLPSRGATGARTETGKKRSSRNAIKHGIFSGVTLLPGESPAKYQSHWEGLRVSLQPQGQAEELLVEKLASLTWRHRRLLLAEGAEIRGGSEFLEWDQRNQQRQEAEEILTRNANSQYVFDSERGLIAKVHNPVILEQCVKMLTELRRQIQENGFDDEADENSELYERGSSILRRIYGTPKLGRETLYESYLVWVATAQLSEEERQRQGCATPEECVSNFLSELDKEIRRLRDYQKESESIESKRTKLEVLKRNVPEPARLDRLLRYEASLERSFDRTLTQLERLQRVRKGQYVPPPIRLEVST
jgi:hypothetical protein